MTPAQRYNLRASEIRSRINAIQGMEERSDEANAELDSLVTEYQAVERDIRAAMVAQDDDPQPQPVEGESSDTSETELEGLHTRSSIGRILQATLMQQTVDGAEAELQQHYGLGDNQVPLALLQTRAVTPAPTNLPRSPQPIIQPVFAQSRTAFMQIPMPTVPVGDTVYPVMTTAPSVKGPFTDSTAAGETTGSFTGTVLSPSRIQASFFYRRTDAARFAGMDAALRQALNSALTEAMDAQILAGTGGLLAGTNLANNAATAIATFQTALSSLVYGRVDGKQANSVADLRILVGSPTYGFLGTLYQGNSDVPAAVVIDNVAGGLAVSNHVPAVASKAQNALIRLGNRMDAVAPIWEGITLIPDPITKASTGEIVITAVMLYAFKILRTSGFRKQGLQITA